MRIKIIYIIWVLIALCGLGVYGYYAEWPNWMNALLATPFLFLAGIFISGMVEGIYEGRPR